MLLLQCMELGGSHRSQAYRAIEVSNMGLHKACTKLCRKLALKGLDFLQDIPDAMSPVSIVSYTGVNSHHSVAGKEFMVSN